MVKPSFPTDPHLEYIRNEVCHIQPIAEGISAYGNAVCVAGKRFNTLVDPGWDRALKDCLGAFASISTRPLRYIILTHSHFDHALNIRAFDPKSYTLVMARTPLNTLDPDMEIGSECRAVLDGVEYHFIPSPGHSADLTDLVAFLPESGLLFCGDLVQPQGESYQKGTGPAPVPFFQYGDFYLASLMRLQELKFKLLYNGHGNFLDARRGRRWIKVTIEAVERIRDLAKEVVKRYPRRDVEAQCEIVYDQVVAERHYPPEGAQWRKVAGLSEAGIQKRPRRGEAETLYKFFDRPGIEYFVRKVRGDPPLKNVSRYLKLESDLGVVAF